MQTVTGTLKSVSFNEHTGGHEAVIETEQERGKGSRIFVCPLSKRTAKVLQEYINNRVSLISHVVADKTFFRPASGEAKNNAELATEKIENKSDTHSENPKKEKE